MPWDIKAAVRTYELTLDDVREMFADKLNVPVEWVTVEDVKSIVPDDEDRFRTTQYRFNGLKITVKEK